MLFVNKHFTSLSGLILSLILTISSISAFAESRTISNWTGKAFNRAVMGQNPGRRDSTRLQTLNAANGSSIRGVAGGWDANTYDWRNLNSGRDTTQTANLTTLNFLRNARDYNAEPLLTVNCRSYGTGALGGDGTWNCANAGLSSTSTLLATLASNWVQYVNNIVQTNRQGNPPTGSNLAIVNSLQWGVNDLLLNDVEAMVPKVALWEIGNEPDLDGFPSYIVNNTESTSIYLQKYAAITAGMKDVDPTISVGPCVYQVSGNTHLTTVLNSNASVDFIGYHPYYQGLRSAWPTANSLETALMGVRTDLLTKYNTCASAISAAGRPSTTQQVASEWNVSMTWYGDATAVAMRVSSAHALGVAESVFTFADLGFRAAHYWEYPSLESTQTVYTELLEDMGNKLIDTYSSANFKMYTVRDTTNNKIAIWALNMDNDTAKEMNIQLSNCPYNLSPDMTLKVLKPANGSASSLASSAALAWESSNLQGLDPANMNVQFRNASISVIVIDTTNPAPVLSSISPSKVEDSPNAQTFTLYGQNFIPESVIYWNGTPKTTTYISPTQIRLTTSAGDIAALGFNDVKVVNPAPGGGESSTVTVEVVDTIVTTKIYGRIASLRRVGSNIEATIRFYNIGNGDAENVQISSAALGVAQTTTSLPANIGVIAQNSSQNMTFTFPGSVGKKWKPVMLKLNGSTTTNAFSLNLRLYLP